MADPATSATAAAGAGAIVGSFVAQTFGIDLEVFAWGAIGGGITAASQRQTDPDSLGTKLDVAISVAVSAFVAAGATEFLVWLAAQQMGVPAAPGATRIVALVLGIVAKRLIPQLGDLMPGLFSWIPRKKKEASDA